MPCELDEQLLDAKLSIPEPREGPVSQAALIEAARGRSCRVVAVAAPAGYGKSTLHGFDEWWGYRNSADEAGWTSYAAFADLRSR